jgi:nitrogen fixation-related uncharacterized protein
MAGKSAPSQQEIDVNTTAIVTLTIVVVVILVALGLVALLWRRRSLKLQEQFGPEYKHAVRQYGDARKAEAELAAREKRVRKLEIRPPTQEDQSRFAEVWRRTQARFVDEPSKAIDEADGLIKSCRRVAIRLETSSNALPTYR